MTITSIASITFESAKNLGHANIHKEISTGPKEAAQEGHFEFQLGHAEMDASAPEHLSSTVPTTFELSYRPANFNNFSTVSKLYELTSGN